MRDTAISVKLREVSVNEGNEDENKKCKDDIKLFDSNILYTREKENKMLEPISLPTFQFSSLNNIKFGFIKN